MENNRKDIKFNIMNISFFKNIYGDKYAGDNTTDIFTILNEIREGGKDKAIARTVESIRLTQDQSRRNELKKQLPVIMWQGVFNEKKDAGLVSLSSVVCIDIDHKPITELQRLWFELLKNPHVLAIFRSPSGDGLKVLVKTNNYDADAYKSCYKQIEELFNKTYGIAPDSNCEAISQGCYMSYDPYIYVNRGAVDFKHTYIPEPPNTNTVNAQQPKEMSFMERLSAMSLANNNAGDNEKISYLDAKFQKFPDNYKDGNRTKSIFIQAGKLCQCGVKKEEALKYLKSRFLPTGYDEFKLEREVDSAYKKNGNKFGTADYKHV